MSAEEHGREHAVGFLLLPAARLPDLRQEALDLGDDRTLVLRKREVPRAGDLDHSCRRNARRHVVSDLGRDDPVLGAAQDQGRNAHRRQDVSHVDLLVHAVERLHCARTGTEADHLEERVRLLVGELAECTHRLAGLLPRAERLQRSIDIALVLVLAAAPLVLGRPHAARKSAAHDERRRSLWISRGEQDTHGGPFREAVERRALRADRIHDRAHVVHARLQRRSAANGVRHAGAALVEPDQTSEGRKLLQEGREGRELPLDLEVRHVPRDEDEVERAVTDDLVGDVDVAAARVAGLGTHAGSFAAWQRLGWVRSRSAEGAGLFADRQSMTKPTRMVLTLDVALPIR
jgi:hypothetical protein